MGVLILNGWIFAQLCLLSANMALEYRAVEIAAPIKTFTLVNFVYPPWADCVLPMGGGVVCMTLSGKWT